MESIGETYFNNIKQKSPMKVFVDPACNVLYSSFYVKGLWLLFGKHNVCFRSRPFRALHYGKDTHIFAFVVNERRYCIDFADSNKIFYPEKQNKDSEMENLIRMLYSCNNRTLKTIISTVKVLIRELE